MTSRDRYRTLEAARATIASHADPYLTVAVADLDAALPLFVQACQRLQDARPSSLGAASYDGPSVSGGSGSDPTARIATTKDATANDRRILDQHLAVLHRFAPIASDHRRVVADAAYGLRRIVVAWTPRRPSDRDRRQVEHANDRGLCEHHRTANLVEYAVREGTVNGNLPHPMALCWQCYKHVQNHNKLPSGEWMERYARTGKAERERIG